MGSRGIGLTCPAFAVWALASAVRPLPAAAETVAATAADVPIKPSRPSDAAVPSCIDGSIVDELGASLRPRGVQKRDFEKDGELAITARGGLVAGDLMSSSYTYGGAAAWFPTEDLGVEIGFDVSPIALDLDAPLAEFFGDDRVEGGTGYLASAGLLLAPIHAKLKMFGSIVHADLMLAGGAGRLFHDSAQGLTVHGGFVLEMFTTRWVTFRIDLRDQVVIQEAASETRLANNLVLTGGLSLWLPTGL